MLCVRYYTLCTKSNIGIESVLLALRVFALYQRTQSVRVLLCIAGPTLFGVACVRFLSRFFEDEEETLKLADAVGYIWRKNQLS